MLTPAEVDHFRSEGYIVLERFFGRELLEPAERTIGELAARAEAGTNMTAVLELEPETVAGQAVPRRIFNPFHQHHAFRALAADSRLLDAIAELVGPDINLHHSKLNMKPPRVGSPVAWHQDLAYFPHTNDDLVTALVYLDDATEENGCLQVLPRCHDRFFDHFLPEGTFAGMITEQIADGRCGHPKSLAAPAGSVILMHCVLPHSSLPNLSDRPRRTLIYEYRAADAYPIYYSERVAATEKNSVVLRGERARRARFGGPPPVIPDMSHLKSLYEMQRESKERLAAGR